MKSPDIERMFISLEPLKLRSMPKKQELRTAVLNRIIQLFENERIYNETEVTHLLMDIYEDPVYLRRLLIEAKLLMRTNDGSRYWKKS